MENPVQQRVTQLLGQLEAGDRDALDELFVLVYETLRKSAHAHRAGWYGDYTLNTTAIVHEAYLKIVDQTRAQWESRAHFLGVASKAMRHILVDYAQRRRTLKRGGDVEKISLEEMKVASENQVPLVPDDDVLLALNEALERLAEFDERAARIVECRVFGGMTVKETAEAIGSSPRTVVRETAAAQAWLLSEMRKEME